MDIRSRSVIKVDDLPMTSKPSHSRAKLASQVSSDQPIDIAALVNLPVYNLSLAQIASHPTWRSQIKDSLTKRYNKRRVVDLTLPADKPVGNCAPWTLGAVNDIETPLVLDGGSCVDIVSLDFVKKLGISELCPSSTVISVANGSSAYPVGEIDNLRISLGSRHTDISNVLVFEHLPYDCLIGRHSLHLLGITTDWAEHVWFSAGSPLNVQYTRAPTVPRIDTSLESDFDSDDNSADGYLICLADVSPLDSISDNVVTPKSDFESFAATPELAEQDRLGNLVDQITANELLTKQQRVDLTSLVRSNSSVFGTSYQHLSKTNLLKLEVNTGDAPPIYRKPLSYPIDSFVIGDDCM
jgi:hypothetical protein